MKPRALLIAAIAALALAGCADTPKSKGYFKVGNPYTVKGQTYYPHESYDYVETGIASWYGPGFNGKKTANGETFDESELTAAHRTLQMPSLLRVTNLENGKSLVVRVNDRGPYSRGRVIDVSKKAADLLGFRMQGTARVRLDIIGPESQIIASAAKRGQDTRGTEVAMNRYGRLEGYDYGESRPLHMDDDEVSLAMAEKHEAEVLEASPVPPQVAAIDPRNIENLQKMQKVFPRNEVETMTLQSPTLPQPVEGHSKAGRFMPDPVVETYPVRPTRLYVQAGSFQTLDNAETLRTALSSLGPTDIQHVMLNGQSFHRVRIGPFDTVEKADRMLNTLVSRGRTGTIVVSEQ